MAFQLCARYRRLIDALDDAERRGALPEMLDALKLTPERMKKLRANPFARIPQAFARRAEKFLGLPRGGLDRETRAPRAAAEDDAVADDAVADGASELLALHARLSPRDRQRLRAIAQVSLS